MGERGTEALKYPYLEEEKKRDESSEDAFERRKKEADLLDIQREIDKETEKDKRKKRIEKSGLSLAEFGEIDKELGVDKEAKERAAAKERDTAYREFYNRVYFYNGFCRELSEAGESGAMAKLDEIGQIMEGEDKQSLIKLMESLAEKAGIEIKAPGELKLLPFGTNYFNFSKELRKQLADFNETTKEFKLREQAYKDLRSDMGEIRKQGGKFDLNLLIHKGLNHIEKELAEKWQAKDMKKNKESLRIKTGALNELSRDLPELRFTPQEKDLVDKGVVLLVGEKEKKAPPQAESEKELPSAIIDQEEANEERGIKRLSALRKMALAKTQDEDIRKEVYNFNPEDYTRKTEKLFAVQNELLNFGALPGGSFGNTLKMFFKYPARYGEVAALQKEYSALSEEIKRQDETIENYLEIGEKKERPIVAREEREKKSALPFSRLREEEARKQDLLPYQKNITEMQGRLQEITRSHPNLAPEIDFTAEDYWRDYDTMMKLQNKLQEECGFFPGGSDTGNLLKATLRGKRGIFLKLKAQYDNAKKSLRAEDEFFESYGGLADKLVIKEKERPKREENLADRLRKSS